MNEQKVDIKVVSGVSAGDIFHFTVTSSSPLVIGREPSCSLVLQDPLVSRRHTSIVLDDGKCYIVDEGSTHGTVHMGFPLQSGPEGRRELHSGDEFKVGEDIFSISFPEDPKETKRKKAVAATGKDGGKMAGGISKGRLLIYLLVGVILLMLLFVSNTSEKPAFPRQKDMQAKSFPVYRVQGYWPGTRSVSKKKKDTAHPDRVIFSVPTSDAVIEYDYRSEVRVDVLIDGALVETLPAYPNSWQHRQLIVKDVLLGEERTLVFNNTEYSPKEKVFPKSRKLRRWAVKNVREVPVGRDIDTSYDALLDQTAALASQVAATPEGLFMAIKSLRKCVIEALSEASRTSIGFAINLEDEYQATSDELRSLNPPKLSEMLQAIRKERIDQLSASTPNLHLQALVEMIAQLDAELWRRFNSRKTHAMLAAKAKNHIEAYDNLLAAKQMFPDETDLRWVRANLMLNNNKIVPKKVRAKPGKFRKK